MDTQKVDDETLKRMLDECPKPWSEWKHYKGEYYCLVTVAINESTQEVMAVYRNLKSGIQFVRPMSEFLDKFTRLS